MALRSVAIGNGRDFREIRISTVWSYALFCFRHSLAGYPGATSSTTSPNRVSIRLQTPRTSAASLAAK